MELPRNLRIWLNSEKFLLIGLSPGLVGNLNLGPPEWQPSVLTTSTFNSVKLSVVTLNAVLGQTGDF